MTAPQLERFLRKINRQPTGCWLWTGASDHKGYGKVRIAGQYLMAHRVAYEHFIAEIPAGLQIDHLCRNRACVNPEHLEPVTCRENIRRGNTGKAAAARAALVTHCPHGHAYTPDNTMRAADNSRHCRTCQRARGARDRKTEAYRARRRIYMRAWRAKRAA